MGGCLLCITRATGKHGNAGTETGTGNGNGKREREPEQEGTPKTEVDIFDRAAHDKAIVF